MSQVPLPRDDFTYNLPASGTDQSAWSDEEKIGVVRLWSGDQPQGKALVADTEIQHLLDVEAPDVYRCALAVLDLMEARLVQLDVSGPAGQAQRAQRTQQIAAYRDRLRTRLTGATNPKTTISATDSYPDRAFTRGRWDNTRT